MRPGNTSVCSDTVGFMITMQCTSTKHCNIDNCSSTFTTAVVAKLLLRLLLFAVACEWSNQTPGTQLSPHVRCTQGTRVLAARLDMRSVGELAPMVCDLVQFCIRY